MNRIKFRFILIGLFMVFLGTAGAHAGTGSAASNIITVDTTDPTGTLTINGGAVYTANPAVSLTLSASDPGGVKEMKFSNDNATWSASETYGTTKTWTISSGDGPKTVYVKFWDSIGNWSAAVSTTITLDTTVPVTTAAPGGGVYGTAQKNVNLSANEAATIYYTTTGSDPTTASTIYTGAIPIAQTTTLKFFAKDLAGNTEAIKTETYTMSVNLPGDMNGDGVVTLADAILAIQWAAGIIPPAGSIQEGYAPTAGDVNGDGKINLTEVTYILQKSAGIR